MRSVNRHPSGGGRSAFSHELFPRHKPKIVLIELRPGYSMHSGLGIVRSAARHQFGFIAENALPPIPPRHHVVKAPPYRCELLEPPLTPRASTEHGCSRGRTYFVPQPTVGEPDQSCTYAPRPQVDAASLRVVGSNDSDVTPRPGGMPALMLVHVSPPLVLQ